MERMNSIEFIDLNKETSHVCRENSTPDVLPCIMLKEPPKRRVLVSRHKNFTSRLAVPLPGHEYNFRRTPSAGRRTPRMLRPHVPPDTNDVDALRMNLDATPTPVKMRPRLRDRIDVNRCPTPMPSEDDVKRVQAHQNVHRFDSSKTNPAIHIAPWSIYDRDLENGFEICQNTVPPSGLLTSRTNAATHGATFLDNDDNNNGNDDNTDDDESDFDLPTPKYIQNKFHEFRRQMKSQENPYHVIPADFEPGRSLTPCPSVSHYGLTEHVLNSYVQKHGYVNRDKMIAKWLVDCEEKSKAGLQVPAILPEIPNPRNNFSVTFTEDL